MLENFTEHPKFLKAVSEWVKVLLESSDWRQVYTGLMILSQMGEHVTSLDELTPVIMVVIGFVKQDHPMIRAACFHCFGQFCRDNKPEFQQKYHQQVFEASSFGLQDKVATQLTQTQRVRAYTCSSLMNLFEALNWEQIKQFADPLLDKVVSMIAEDSIFVAKTAIGTLGAFCMATSYNSSKYYRRTFQVLYQTFKQKQHRSVMLSCRLIEAITISAFFAEETDFKDTLEDIKYIMKYFESIIPNTEDQRVSFLLSAWSRLISRMKSGAEEFAEYICSILLKILHQCELYR